MVVLLDPKGCPGPTLCRREQSAPRLSKFPGDIVFGGSMCGCPCHQGGECMGQLDSILRGLVGQKEHPND